MIPRNPLSLLMAPPTGSTPPGVCSNGLSGVQFEDICCSLSCGTCGGLGCGGRDGGRDECCTSAITNEGVRCSDSGVAPCIVDDGEGITLSSYSCTLGFYIIFDLNFSDHHD